ncbi:MAG: hypothetical protein J6Y29_04425 [Clostridiales bacterium]|nr:hypothetical protein [Clostridiales bacterium]
MSNASEIEKLKKDVESIDDFLAKERAYIASATKEVIEIEKEENSLKLLYPDVCELDAQKEKINENKKMLDELSEDAVDDRKILEERIESLKSGLNGVVERLNSHGIHSKDDYKMAMDTVQAKKESIPNINVEIKKKELDIVEQEERKKTILLRIEELEQEGEELSGETVEQSTPKDELKPEKDLAVSELAAFIDYQQDDEPKVKSTATIEKKTGPKKKETLDIVIEDMLNIQKKVENKFQEIMHENKEEDLTKSIEDFHNKFLEIIYQRVNDATKKLMDKKEYINTLTEYANQYTPDMEDERLIKLKDTITSSIKEIETKGQKFEEEIKYSFNEASEYAKNEFSYLEMLQSRIKDQIAGLQEKIDNIEKELGELKGNSKEGLLENINNKQKVIDDKERILKEMDKSLKEDILNLLDNIKEKLSKIDTYENVKDTLGELENSIKEKVQETDNHILSIKEEIEKLSAEKTELEKKYEEKKDSEESDTEKEALLVDSKNMLKEEAQKIIDTMGILGEKNNEFLSKLDENKKALKDKIKVSDLEVVKDKKELLEKAKEEIKPYNLRLFENVEEYNNEYTKEFDRYMTKVISDIDEMKNENNAIKANVHNIVVSSEFDENIQLMDELKNSINKVLSTDKLTKNVEQPPKHDKTKFEQEIEESIVYIKPEETIDEKIDFSGIYYMEDKVKDLDELKESISNVCERLGVEYGKRSSEPKDKKAAQTKKMYVKDKSHENIAGLEGYDENIREILMDIAWDQLEELKNMNVKYNKILYINDLKEIRDEKVMKIAKLKEDYKNAVEAARKLYDIKKYVLAYKKGMEELARGAKSNDKDDQMEYNKLMKVATKSLKTMQENGISSFEDFRSKVVKNSDLVKQVLANTKMENEELVKIASLIKAIEIASNEYKESTQKTEVG